MTTTVRCHQTYVRVIYDPYCHHWYIVAACHRCLSITQVCSYPHQHQLSKNVEAHLVMCYHSYRVGYHPR